MTFMIQTPLVHIYIACVILHICEIEVMYTILIKFPKHMIYN